MFFRNTIKSRVTQAINKKINDAEDLYEDKCQSIDDQLEADITNLETVAKNNKIAFADLMVNDILSKII